MSATAERLPFVQARFVANQLEFLMKPLCQKLEIAGSVRRCEASIGDIEIVCIPHLREKVKSENLFEKEVEYLNRVALWVEDSANTYVQKVKGRNKYIQFLYKNTYKVDVFMVEPGQWGRQLALRTGPAKFSKKMASRWVQLGYHGINGRLIDAEGNESPEFPTEESFFDFLNWIYIEPSKRG